MPDAYYSEVERHYIGTWGAEHLSRELAPPGPVADLPAGFCVLRFPDRGARRLHIYATCGMSTPGDQDPLELHLFAPGADTCIVEVLYAVAHYHRTGASLGLSHTVNLGRPWWHGSECDHALISLPYLHGPGLEWGSICGSRVRFLWLLPITKSERDFKRLAGVEALEQKFDAAYLDYANPHRASVA